MRIEPLTANDTQKSVCKKPTRLRVRKQQGGENLALRVVGPGRQNRHRQKTPGPLLASDRR